MCQVCSQYIVSYKVQALSVFLLTQVFQQIASLSVKNTHGLSKVMSLHNATLAGVEGGKDAVAGDLEILLRNACGRAKYTWKVLFVPLWSRSWHMQAISRANASRSLGNIEKIDWGKKC